MKNFAEFLKANREKIYADAESKTLRNSKGQTVIERSDPWFDEDEWDDYYKELTARDNDSAAGRVVC